jgi:WD40 repeat protein
MVGEQLHHGPVVGLSVCAWKPLFMTCGQLDRTVRVWNYETEMQELVKQYQDEIFSVAMHPTGTQRTAQPTILSLQYIWTVKLREDEIFQASENLKS